MCRIQVLHYMLVLPLHTMIKLFIPRLQKRAVNNSVLENYLITNLSLQDGLKTKLPQGGDKTILRLIQDGSTAEDALDMCRAVNHFLDPTKPWDVAGMSDQPWFISCNCNSWKPFYSAVTWATGYVSSTAAI